MIGLHDHHRAHSTRVARTVEKTFASFSPGHASHPAHPHPTPSPQRDRPAPTHRSLSPALWRNRSPSPTAATQALVTERPIALPPVSNRGAHHAITLLYLSQELTRPKTRQQADTGIMTDAESLRNTWSMTLNVNCPHCGQMHAVSVRETYIDAEIRNVSEIARRV
jgi:hypothetical protein